MVIIQLLTLLTRNIIMPLIIIVMINNGNIISETVTQSVRKSRLSRPGSSGDSYNNAIHFLTSLFLTLFLFYHTKTGLKTAKSPDFFYRSTLLQASLHHDMLDQ